jgi:hypothetical protein
MVVFLIKIVHDIKEMIIFANSRLVFYIIGWIKELLFFVVADIIA